jgi:DNA invertase Pin-like site-specific DNA recombinase
MSPSLDIKTAAYARVSRRDEQPILDNQIATIRGYCIDKGLDLGDRLYSEVVSGGKENRVALNDLLSIVERRGGPKLVVFTSLSRMTRGGIGSALYILKRLERAGVGWHFTDQPILNYDSGTPPLARDIILAVLAAVDEDYRRNISAKTTAALAARKNLGIRLGRPPKCPECGHRRKHGPKCREPKCDCKRSPQGPKDENEATTLTGR